MSSNRINIPQLTFTRFVAAMVIVLYHYGIDVYPFDSGLLKDWIEDGPISVNYFFFLSGFILTVAYWDRLQAKGYKDFLLARFARIYPVYLLGFLLALFLGMLLIGAYPRGFSIILQSLLLHAWVPGICLEINYPSWSLSVEAFLYLTFPLLFALMRKWGDIKFIIMAIAFWAISGIWYVYLTHYASVDSPNFGEFVNYFPINHLNTFVFGMAAAIVFIRLKDRKIPSYLPTVVFILSLLFFGIIYIYDNPWTINAHNGLLSPLFLVILVSLSLDKSFVSSIMGGKTLAFFGEISYGVYILQYPVYLLYAPVRDNYLLGFGPLTNLFIYITLLLVISSLIFYYFERPLRVWIKKKLS